MMQDQPAGASVEADLNVLKELLDTTVNRRLNETIAKISEGLDRVRQIFDEVQKSIAGGLSISQTAWHVTGESGRNTLFWNRPGSSDRILSVTYEVVPTGEELLVRMAGETVYRTDLAQPVYGESFRIAVRGWLVAQLRARVIKPA